MAEKSKAKAADKADATEADQGNRIEPEGGTIVLDGTAGVVDPNAAADAANAATNGEPQEGEDAAQPLPKARKGHKYVQYIGSADVLTHGEQRFRPGEWVEVPKDVAEELLTFPFEEFRAMEAEGDDG